MLCKGDTGFELLHKEDAGFELLHKEDADLELLRKGDADLELLRKGDAGFEVLCKEDTGLCRRETTENTCVSIRKTNQTHMPPCQELKTRLGNWVLNKLPSVVTCVRIEDVVSHIPSSYTHVCDQ